MAVLTWRNVNAPSGGAVRDLTTANNVTNSGFESLNQSLDKFQAGRSNMAESELTRRMLAQPNYDQYREAQASGELTDGINVNHLTSEALGRVNNQTNSLLQRSVQEEGLKQSRTTFGNQQDDRANEQAAAPIVNELYQAASRGDTDAVNSLYAQHGDLLSSVPLDRLQSIATGSMDLEQGRSGINNQLHGQRMAEANYGLAARRVANSERKASQDALNKNLTAGFVNLLGRSATSPADFERLYEAEVGNNPDIPITVKQEVWEEGLDLFPGSYGIGEASGSRSGSGSNANGEEGLPAVRDSDLLTARTTLADNNFDRATRGAPTYYRSMMQNINDPRTTAEVAQELRSGVAADIPQTDLSDAIEQVQNATQLPPAAAGAIVTDSIMSDRGFIRDGIEMALYGPGANLDRYGINNERLEASIAEVTSKKTQDNVFADQLGQEYQAGVKTESNRLEGLLRQKASVERRAQNNPRLGQSLDNLEEEIQEARRSLRRALESDAGRRSLLE